MATKSPTKFHSSWGVFSSLSTLPNVSGSPTQDSSLEVGDRVYVTGYGLYQCLDATLGAAVWESSVPGEKVLWEWNETDLTQFTGPDGWGTPPTVALTVETLPNTLDGAARKIIKGTISAGASGGCAWWINDLPALPDDFIIEHVQGPRSGSGLYQNTVPEVLVGQDNSHMITLGRGGPGAQTTHNLILLNGTTMNVGGGYRTMATGVLHNDDAGYPMRHRFSVRDPTPSTDPRVWVQSLSPPVAPGVMLISQATWNLWGSGTQPWHASWRSGGTMKKIGFHFTVEGGLGSSFIAGLRVLAL